MLLQHPSAGSAGSPDLGVSASHSMQEGLLQPPRRSRSPRLRLPPIPHTHPHLLQGVRRDLLAPPKDRAVVLGGETLQLGAQGLLLLRDNAEGARLGVRRTYGAPQPAPLLPTPLQVSWGREL